jgi:hypothetical protein
MKKLEQVTGVLFTITLSLWITGTIINLLIN